MFSRVRAIAVGVVGVMAASVLALSAPMAANAGLAHPATTDEGAGAVSLASAETSADFADPQDLSPVECGDLLVVGARGSGEADGYGDKVGDAVDLLHDMLDSSHRVRYVSLSYPAAAMSVLADDLTAVFSIDGSEWNYYSSVFSGTEQLVDELGDSLVNCPDERWILVGYSQGSLVIDQALHLYDDPSRYAAIIKIADAGRRSASGVRNVGTADAGDGITASTGGLPFSLPTNEVPSSLAPVTVEICNQYDIVCDTSNALGAQAPAAAIAAGVQFHSDTYPKSLIGSAIDVVRPRILGMPAAAQRHSTVTSCLGEPVLSGTLATPARPSSEPDVKWALAPGYSPAAAADAAGIDWDAASDFVLVDTDGSWQASLPVGGWSIPLVLSADGYTDVHAWLDISVASSCEAAYTCGPDLAPSHSEVPYPEGEITGRILCPDGRPAGGVRVQTWGMDNTWVTTDERGMYRLSSGWRQDDKVYITAVLNGFPDMVGGDPRGEAGDVDSALYAPDEQRVRAPDYRFTEYSFLRGSVAVEGGVRDGGADAVRVTAWAIPADGDTRWSFNSNGTKGPGTGDGGIGACLEYASSGYCARAGQDADGSYFVRVLPGDYKVGYSEGWSNLYAEWYGSRDIDAHLDLEEPPASATVVHAEPGATVDLGTKNFDYVSRVWGSASTSLDGETIVGISSVPLPVGAYVRTADGWKYVADEGPEGWASSTFGGWASANWAMSVVPGEYRIVLNDPHAAGYDPAYDTIFAPGVHALENATSITVGRGEVLTTPWQWNVVSRLDAAVKKGTVVGTVRDADGNPVEDASVELTGADSSYSVVTGSGGRFVIAAAPGRYTAGATRLDGTESWWGGVDAASANVVTVTAFADAAGVDIMLGDAEGGGGNETPDAFVSTQAPVVTGIIRVGATLTAYSGAWSRIPDTTTFQWFANGVPISGATSPTYVIPASQLGVRLSVAVTATAGSDVATAASVPTPAVAVGTLTTKTPTISGSVAYKSTVSAKPGAWTSGTSFSYQWYANGKAIAGATKSTFKIGSAQKAKKLTVRVIGKKSGYTSVAKMSVSTGKVATAATPKISGKAKVGKKLTAKPGAWTSGTTFTYQWYANGKAIKGATKATLTLKKAQKGKKITVTVTGKKSGYATVAKTSKATGKVKK